MSVVFVEGEGTREGPGTRRCRSMSLEALGCEREQEEGRRSRRQGAWLGAVPQGLSPCSKRRRRESEQGAAVK